MMYSTMSSSSSCRSMVLQRFLVRRCLPATVAVSRRQHPVSVFVALTVSAATTLQQHPMSTLAETPTTSAKTTTDHSSSQVPPGSAAANGTSIRQLHHHAVVVEQSHHHFYGSPLVPQDIYFNDIVREGLGTIRRQHAIARNEDENDADASHSSSSSSSNSQLDTGRLEAHRDSHNQALSVLERSGHRHAATLTLIGFKGGDADDQINQDRAVVISPFSFGQDNVVRDQTIIAEGTTQDSCFLGVFDGHGPLGELVSEYSVSELPRRLARKLKAMGKTTTTTTSVSEEVDCVKQILVDSFVEIDKDAPAEKSGGCTASVILQLGNKLYVANAGDSRSFIVCYRKRTKVANIVYISREDKPHLPEEKARLEKLGGLVSMPTKHGSTSRVYYTNPSSGFVSGLAMSRSIGDREAGKLGVIPDPIVDVMDIAHLVDTTRNNTLSTPSFVVLEGFLEDDDALNQDTTDDVYMFAVSATDGLMDYLSQEAIAATLAHSLFEEDGPHLLTACEALIKAAAAGWFTMHQGRYRDDIAIAVSRLRIPPPSI